MTNSGKLDWQVQSGFSLFLSYAFTLKLSRKNRLDQVCLVRINFRMMQ